MIYDRLNSNLLVVTLSIKFKRLCFRSLSLTNRSRIDIDDMETFTTCTVYLGKYLFAYLYPIIGYTISIWPP